MSQDRNVDDNLFNPQVVFEKEFAEKRLAIVEHEREVLNKKKEALKHNNGTEHVGNDLISAFNLYYRVGKILIMAGYAKKNGVDFYRHQNSTSGSHGASVQNNRVVSLNANDPLYKFDLITQKHQAYDAFGAFCILFHNGDINAALKDAGDNWVKVGDESWNNKKQREYALANKQTAEELFACVPLSSDIPPSNNVTPFGIIQSLSMTQKINEMEENLQNEFYIIDEMALAGQITLFFAKPNTGKTLFFIWFLIQSIKSKTINAADVIYINEDDHYKGLYTKTKIAEKYGFLMISPTNSNISTADIIKLLDDLSQTDEAKGKIIILDTLKKFAEMMIKKSLSDLFVILRKLIAKNATVIIAGHANKHLNSEGDLVYEGTSDTMNDIDCAYAMYQVSKNDAEFIVEFRNEKARGDVVIKVSYEYSKKKGMNYYEILESVHKLDGSEVGDVKHAHALMQSTIDNSEIIAAIKNTIENSSNLKTELIETVARLTNKPNSKIKAVLDLHTGDDPRNCGFWNFKRGDKNSMTYYLTRNELPPEPPVVSGSIGNI